MNDDLMEGALSTLLRDRVATEHPDLDLLTRIAAAQGRRIRRRRQVGITLGAAAAVVAVGFGAAAMVGSTPQATAPQWTTGSDAPPAASSAPEPLHPGMRLRLPSGASMKVLAPADVRGIPVSSHLIRHLIYDKVDALYLRQTSGVTIADLEWLTGTYPGITTTLPLRGASDGDAAASTGAERQPAKVSLAGWTCGTAADHKVVCSGLDGVPDLLVWRPAAVYADWSAGNADKQADWVSTVHRGVFVTIDGPRAAALGASLVWK